MGREADEEGLAPVRLADELSEIDLAAPAPVRGPGIAQVGIMRPDHDLRGITLPAEMNAERFERLAHVPVAQVPSGFRR
jgi:hypothetical protein